MEKHKNVPVRIRPVNDSDISFIFNSWLRCYRATPFGRNMANTIFYTEHHKVIERLLKTADVYVACNDLDVADIYGYICAERVQGIFVVHFVYVKHMYRSLGIGKMLLNEFNHDSNVASLYTHNTLPAQKLASKFNMVYHPYIALTPDYRKEILEPKKESESGE